MQINKDNNLYNLNIFNKFQIFYIKIIKNLPVKDHILLQILKMNTLLMWLEYFDEWHDVEGNLLKFENKKICKEKYLNEKIFSK